MTRREMIGALIHAGMNVARINTSHGTQDDHAQLIKTIRSVASRMGSYVPILLDLSGPKMRIGTIAAGSATLRAGDSFALTTRLVPGDWREVSFSYPALIADVTPGDRILMGDGEIELKVVSKN